MDDEIVVGVNLKQKNTSNKEKSKKKNSSKSKNTKKTVKNPKEKTKKVKLRKNAKIILYVFLFIVVSILLINSPLFNVKKIEVEGNSKVSDEKVVNLSGVQLDSNIFKLNKLDIIEKIKYIGGLC